MNVTSGNQTWRRLATASWVGILLCQVAVAVTSRNIGKSAWWLGPESNPRFPIIWAVPFLITLAALIATLRTARHTIIIHLACVALLVAVATGDISNSPGVAMLQYVVAGIALVVSFVSLAARP